MSFGWSAGDIASAVKLLYTIGKALKESCGASSDFAEISAFLTTLQTTLRLLQSLNTLAFNPESGESIAEQLRACTGSGGKKFKILTAPRKIQWALVMPSKIKKLQEKIGGPMITVNALISSQALQLISQLQDEMPDVLKGQLETLLENLTMGIDASVVQPLERALHECKEEAVASHERAAGEMFQKNQQINENIAAELRSFNGQYLDHLTSAQQALQEAMVKLDHTGRSNQDQDRKEQSLSTMISETQGEIRKLQSTWQSIPGLAAQLDLSGDENDDLAIAFHRMSLQLKICVWLIIGHLQRQLQELMLLFVPFFAVLYQKCLAEAKRIPLLMIGERFSFEDALGRTRLLSCTDFQSWDIFRSFLQTSFEGLPGSSYVLKDRFEIVNAYNGTWINQNVWRAVIQPKTKFAMAMILARKNERDALCPTPNCTENISITQDHPSGRCPTCKKYMTIATSRTEVHVTVFEDSNPLGTSAKGPPFRPSYTSSPNGWATLYPRGGSGKGIRVKSHKEIPLNRDDIAHFKRIAWVRGILLPLPRASPIKN